uniref:Uncharacterized protein n=1 Tax=Anguilla anguilla TaxID=7936 RepID=A0A0E9V3B9_ANGAN
MSVQLISPYPHCYFYLCFGANGVLTGQYLFHFVLISYIESIKTALLSCVSLCLFP